MSAALTALAGAIAPNLPDAPRATPPRRPVARRIPQTLPAEQRHVWLLNRLRVEATSAELARDYAALGMSESLLKADLLAMFRGGRLHRYPNRQADTGGRLYCYHTPGA